MKHAITWVLAANLILGVGLLGWVNYSLFWPVQTLVINNYSEKNPVPVITTEIEPGQALEYILDYCKYSTQPSVVHRNFIDGQIISLQDGEGKLPLGCHKTIVKTAIVPTTINPGKYYLDVRIDYEINKLRTIETHYHTTYFTVVKKGTGPAVSTDNKSNLPVLDASNPVNSDGSGITTATEHY